jgi:cold-inducible RNA-binding protein
MAKNLYVGNLPFTTTSEHLREAFAQYGTVSRAQVIVDRETGRSRGFGFVEMESGAEDAVTKMNGAAFQGRTLTVNEAQPRAPRTGGGGGGYGGGGGGYGGGRGGRGGYGGGGGGRGGYGGGGGGGGGYGGGNY